MDGRRQRCRLLQLDAGQRQELCPERRRGLDERLPAPLFRQLPRLALPFRPERHPRGGHRLPLHLPDERQRSAERPR